MSKPQTILETKRLLLRHLMQDDLDDLFALYCNPEITKYIPDAPRNYTDTKEELEWFLNGHPRHPELGLWATVHKETGRFIGRCGLLPWTIEGQQEVEVAYALAQDFWGQGLATEAAYGILQYGFEQLHLSRLICLIDPANIASRRVAEKIGMTLEKKVEGIDGDGIPSLIYSIHGSAVTDF
ncbi:MAG: GNAT family N-acetyltransferase [Omnitrophica WOR_2 bacterium]